MNKKKVIFYYAHSNKMVYTDDDFLQSDKVAVQMGLFSVMLLLAVALILSVFSF
jgi:hypothetical protein